MPQITLNPGNIYSGNRKLSVFTNPTELAFRKGCLRNHYPVTIDGTVYPDAEAAYQQASAGYKHSAELCYAVCIEVIAQKLRQHKILMQTIRHNGGERWLSQCQHRVNGRAPRWEGDGVSSGFIRCLISAYHLLQINLI